MKFFDSRTISMVIGAVIGSGSFLYTHSDILIKARADIELIEQCEAGLPRDQTCELVAQPVEPVE
jgi:hypothetical protein